MSLLLNAIKQKRQARKDICDKASAIVVKIATEQRAKPDRVWTPEENQEFERMHKDAEGLQGEIEKLQRQYDLEVSLTGNRADTRTGGLEDIAAPGAAVLANQPKEVREKVKRLKDLELRRWLVADDRVLRVEIREEHAQLTAEVGPIYQRALSAVTGNLGQDTVPQGFVYQLEVATKYYGGIIDAADYIDTEMGNLLPWPSINDTANKGEVITENTQVAGSSGGASEQDPAFGVTNLSAWMFDTGFVLVPIQLLQDSAFNVEQYLNDLLPIRIGRDLNYFCTVGSGTNQPTGIVNAITNSSAIYNAAAAAAIAYNDTLNLYHQVDPSYRDVPGVGYMFNDSTLLAIKKLLDSNNRPLFIAGGTAEGIQNGSPGTINGKPYWINQDMQSIGNTHASMLFGCFKKYKIRRVKTLQMVRANERFIDVLQVGFLAFQRHDGQLIDAGTHPVAKLVHPAS